MSTDHIEYKAFLYPTISKRNFKFWFIVFCRSSRCRHLHPKDLERMNYTLSGHYHRHGQTRMALKTAGFLAAIERGAHFIFQANPGKIYFCTPKYFFEFLRAFHVRLDYIFVN